MFNKARIKKAQTQIASGVQPKLRFPEFRGEAGWEVKRLENIASIISERAGNKKFKLMSITSGVGLVSQIEKFGREIAGLQYKNYFVINKNDFAYNKSSTKEYPEGFIAMHSDSIVAAVPNSIFTCFRIQNNKVLPKYLNYLFWNNIHGKWLRKFISIGARAHGSLNVDNTDLMSLPIPLPQGQTSCKEQQKIADCLSSVDDLIGAQKQKIETLKNHKKALMQQLFPAEDETLPKLRFPEFRGEAEWEETKLGKELASISNGITLEQNDKGSGFKVTRIETISEKTIDINKIGFVETKTDISFYQLKIGDILFSNINSLAHIGKTAIVDKSYNLYHGMNLLRLQFDTNHTVPMFFFYLLNIDAIISSVRRRANQAVNQASINQTELGNTIIFLPKVSEQQKIADCLSSIDELISLHTKKWDALKLHKKGLMQQLFPDIQEESE